MPNTIYTAYQDTYTNPVTSVDADTSRLVSGSMTGVRFIKRPRPSTKYDPHHADYVTGSASGSNTAGFDAYRQGISVVSDRLFYMGTTPSFGFHSEEGKPRFLLEMVQEGEPVTFDAFND